MAKKVLVIGTSLRPNSNSDVLADAFAEGAKAAGNEVEQISLKGKELRFCIGCLSCLKRGSCFMKDDAPAIAEKMKNADVIAFATPVYYYEMCGQMKTLLDRANSLYGSDYRFGDIYILTTAAEPEESATEGAIHGLKGWIACFERARFAGAVFAGGVDGAGTIEGHQAVKEAYQKGTEV